MNNPTDQPKKKWFNGSILKKENIIPVCKETSHPDKDRNKKPWKGFFKLPKCLKKRFSHTVPTTELKEKSDPDKTDKEKKKSFGSIRDNNAPLDSTHRKVLAYPVDSNEKIQPDRKIIVTTTKYSLMIQEKPKLQTERKEKQVGSFKWHKNLKFVGKLIGVVVLLTIIGLVVYYVPLEVIQYIVMGAILIA